MSGPIVLVPIAWLLATLGCMFAFHIATEALKGQFSWPLRVLLRVTQAATFGTAAGLCSVGWLALTGWPS